MPDGAKSARSSVVAVIGMHRSGTSLTMQALGALGAQSGGDLVASDDFNRNGYWEASEVVAFHDRLLDALGRHWGTPEHLLPVPETWWGSPAANAARSEARSLLAARLGSVESGSVLAVKDPRMTLFLPLWTDAAADLAVKLRVILCLRHPAEVAASLTRRDGLDTAMGQSLWLAYTLAAIEQAATVTTHLCRLDDWYLDPIGSLRRIADFAGLSAEGVVPPFSPELATQDSTAAIGDSLIAQWWQDLALLPPDGKLAAGMTERARLLRLGAGQGTILASAIRAEIGDTPAHLLLRDVEAYRRGVEKIQDAYAQEAEARRAFQTQASKFQDAYAQEAEARLAYQEHAAKFQKAYAQEAEARAALQEEYLRLQARIARLNPLNWFRKQ